MSAFNVDLHESILAALNAKAAEEFAASHAYLAASLWFDERDFDGIAGFLLKESTSEREHGLSFLDYIIKRGGHAKSPAVPETDTSAWSKATHVFETLVKMEVKVTRTLENLLKLAREHNDPMTETLIQDFLKMQIDEIDGIQKLLSKVKAYDAMPGLLWHLNAELS